MLDGEGRSRGYGTVLYSTTREAAKAIQLFNESFLLGRQVIISSVRCSDEGAMCNRTLGQPRVGLFVSAVCVLVCVRMSSLAP